MEAYRNPFAPGAGTQPPELAGRDDILQAAEVALVRSRAGRHGKSQMLLGLRGVGKTVLLNKIDAIAADSGHETIYIEAPETGALPDLLFPRLQSALKRLSTYEKARRLALAAQAALMSFARAFKVKYEGFTMGVEPDPGVADSGALEIDLPDLMLRVGEAAKAADRGLSILIDEVQYLSGEELSALIVAMHRVNQRGLPVLFFGAGLPQTAALSGNAKSYAERLFDYLSIGPLDATAAAAAIREPIEAEGETIEADAIEKILQQSEGYPYFLQEWGFQAWAAAEESPITAEDVTQGSATVLQRLDDGFFRVRMERLTPTERDYCHAMTALGRGPYRSADVADQLGKPLSALGTTRANIIRKGMIYSPAYGEIAFTVPMFEDHIRRNNPELFQQSVQTGIG